MVLDKWMRRLIKAGRTRPYLRRLLVMLAAPLYGMLLLGDRVKDGVYRGLQSAARRLRAGAEKAKAAWSNGKRMLKRRLSTIRRGIPAQGAGIGRRITALALMLALIIGVFPVGVWAAEPASGCTHVHDTDCGYTQGQEAAACDKGCTELDGAGQIVHSPQCSYRLALAGTDCRHICDAACGAMATENAEQAAQLGQTDCTCGVQLDADGDSTHLEGCPQYAAAPLSECQICGGAHESESCPVTAAEALISALPSEELVAQWSDQQRQEHGIYAQLEAAYLAYDALTDSQKALLPGAEETLAGLFSAVSGPAMTMELANDWITEADVSWYTDPAHVSGDPYVISTAAQLAGLALIVNQGQGSNPPDTFANQTIQLAQDLDLSGKTWTPIGKNSYFAGIFDGQGHTIRGLDVPNSKMNYEGLFGDIRGQSADALCVIQDLAVEGSVQGNQYAGGIAATMKWATIERCASRVAVSGIEYLGGIVGQMEQTATIRNCYATGAIQGQNLLGGIAGHCKDWGADKANTIENCYATSAITATSSSPYAGGILGQGMGGFILKNCVALNPYIKSAGTEKFGGRVVDSAGPNVSGNYAREDMKLKPQTSDNTATSANGASIALGTEQSWNTWFDTTAAASAWSNYPVQALDSGAALPTLSAINLGAEEAPLLPMVVKTLTLSASTEQQIKVGDTLQLTATVDPQNAVVQWQSVDPSVATVDQTGLVTGVAKGVTEITASAGDMTASVTIIVGTITAQVTAGGKTTSYVSFDTALQAAQATQGSVLKLMQWTSLNLMLDRSVSLNASAGCTEYTIDLGGQELELGNGHFLLDQAGTTINIIDSGTGGSMTGTAQKTLCIRAGTIHIQSGTITNDQNKTGQQYTILLEQDGRLKLSGGTIRGTAKESARTAYAVYDTTSGGNQFEMTGAPALWTKSNLMAHIYIETSMSAAGYTGDLVRVDSDNLNSRVLVYGLSDMTKIGSVTTMGFELMPVAEGVFLQKAYKLTLNKNGGTGYMNDLKIWEGKEITLPPCDFTKQGYRFTGWNTARDGSGTAYADEATMTINTAQGITIYAQWEATQAFLGAGSEGAIDPLDGTKATGLTPNQYYMVTCDRDSAYVTPDGTLSDSKSACGLLTGTEISGLEMGKTYTISTVQKLTLLISGSLDDQDKVEVTAGGLTDTYVGTTTDAYAYYRPGTTVMLKASPSSGRMVLSATLDTGDPGTAIDIQDAICTADGATLLMDNSYNLAVAFSNIPADSPVITQNPQDLALTYNYATGPSVTVRATAAAGHILSYVWFCKQQESPESPEPCGTDASFVIPTGWEAGSYVLYCQVTATRKDNLQTASVQSQTATVRVSPADGEAAVVLEGWTYGEAATPPQASSSTNQGEPVIEYKLEAAPESDYSSQAPTAAGSYTVKATFAATKNYNQVCATQTFIIAKRPVSITAKDQVIQYGQTIGQGAADYAISASSAGTGLVPGHTIAGLTLTPSTSNVTEVGTITPSAAVIQADGQQVSGNYEITYLPGSLKIEAVDYPEDIAWPQLTAEFGQTLRQLTLPEHAGGTFSWKDSSTVPTVTNDGYAVTFTPTDRNYAAVDGVAAVTVAPKELTLPGFAAQPRVYTPGDTSVDYTVGALSGLESGFRDVIVDITGITAQLDSPDQGERIVTLSGDLKLIGSHAENYTLRQPDNLRVTISKRAYDSGYGFTISELSDQPYTGKPVTPIPEIKYGDTPLIEGTDFELSYVNNVLAGPQPVLTIKFQGNYTGQKSMSFSIFNTPLPRDQFETVFGVSDSDLRSWHKQDIVLTGIAPWSIGQTLAEIDSNQITLQNEGRECTDGFYCKKEGSDILYFATVVYSLDKTGPEITSAEVSTTKWTNQAVTVTITASDRLSRLAGEAYSFDGGRTWQKEPMKAFSQDTVLMPQTLCVRDTAGNVSQYPSPVTISNIDTDLPTVSVEPSPDPQKWYGKTVFTVTARDNKSGVQSTVVSEGDLDGVPVLDGTFTAEPAQAGTYTYTVTVTDKADNTKSQQVTVQIDPIIDTFAALVQDLNGESELAALLSALDSHAAYTNDQKQHIENSVQGMAALQKLQQAFSDKQDALLLELNTILQRYPDEISISDIDRAETLYKLLDSEHLAQIETLEIYQQLLLDRQQAQLALEQLNTASQDDAGYEQKQTAQNTYDSLSPAQKNLVEKQAPGAQELLNTDLEAVNQVIRLINAIQRPYSLEQAAAIQEAALAYSQLNAKQQALVPTAEAQRLTSVQSMYQHALLVSSAIEPLSEPYQQSETDAIEQAHLAYSALTKLEQEFLSQQEKDKLIRLVKAMQAQRSDDETAAIDFAAQLKKVMADPSVEGLQALKKTYEALSEAAKALVSEKDTSDYNRLQGYLSQEVLSLISDIDAIEMEQLTAEQKPSVDALESRFNALGSVAIQQLVDKATGGKLAAILQAFQDAALAQDAIGAIAVHPDGGLSEQSCLEQGHTLKEHKTAIEAAKIVYERLTDAGRKLVQEQSKVLLRQQYDALMALLEYQNKDAAANTQVEVAGLAENVQLPAGLGSDARTVVSVVLSDEKTQAMPERLAEKTQAVNVELYLQAQAYRGTTPLGEPVKLQPKQGKTVLVKLKIPAGYQMDTLEIWHIKENGLPLEIPDFWLATEPDGVYAVFEISSFSHFVLYAEKLHSTADSETRSVTVKHTENGSVTVSTYYPIQGQTVTVTAMPDKDYVVQQVLVKNAAGEQVPVTQIAPGNYQFVQPAGSVSVMVSFAKSPIGFTDVLADDWFYSSVQYVVQQGLMQGTSEERFSPYETTSRAMLVTILWRLEGKPAAAGAAFDDVDPDAWYAQAVAWASGNALVEGYGGSVFGPGDPITREQLAAVLYRYVQWKGQKALPQGVQLERFQDAGQVSAWAKEAVDWAVASGLLQGRGDKTLAPKNSANRAELAAMLQRFLTQLAQPS